MTPARPCAFCAVAGGADAHLVHADERIIAFLDRAPLIKGHVLVIPRAHVETFDDLPGDLIAPLFTVVQRISRSFARALGADGSYTAINTRVSQSVPHVHVHVVPRSSGDGLFRAGMVWIRKRYDDGEAAQLAKRLREAIAAS
jgi:histidine triad (HIT) family protein